MIFLERGFHVARYLTQNACIKASYDKKLKVNKKDTNCS